MFSHLRKRLMGNVPKAEGTDSAPNSPSFVSPRRRTLNSPRFASPLRKRKEFESPPGSASKTNVVRVESDCIDNNLTSSISHNRTEESLINPRDDDIVSEEDTLRMQNSENIAGDPDYDDYLLASPRREIGEKENSRAKDTRPSPLSLYSSNTEPMTSPFLASDVPSPLSTRNQNSSPCTSPWSSPSAAKNVRKLAECCQFFSSPSPSSRAILDDIADDTFENISTSSTVASKGSDDVNQINLHNEVQLYPENDGCESENSFLRSSRLATIFPSILPPPTASPNVRANASLSNHFDLDQTGRNDGLLQNSTVPDSAFIQVDSNGGYPHVIIRRATSEIMIMPAHGINTNHAEDEPSIQQLPQPDDVDVASLKCNTEQQKSALDAELVFRPSKFTPLDQKWYSPRKKWMMPSHRSPGDSDQASDDGSPKIVASQSLPSTDEEMMDPLSSISYRMRALRNFRLEKRNLYLDKQRVASEMAIFAAEDCSAEGDKPTDDSNPMSAGNSSPKSVSQQRCTPLDQKWFSPRRTRMDHPDSPSSLVLSTKSLPNREDGMVDSPTNLSSYRIRVCRRGAGGTPISIGFKKPRKSSKDNQMPLEKGKCIDSPAESRNIDDGQGTESRIFNFIGTEKDDAATSSPDEKSIQGGGRISELPPGSDTESLSPLSSLLQTDPYEHHSTSPTNSNRSRHEEGSNDQLRLSSTYSSSPIDTSCPHNNDSGVTSDQRYTVSDTLVHQAVTTKKENAITCSSTPIDTSCLHNNDPGVNETSDQRYVLKSSPRAVALTVTDTLVHQAVTTKKENAITCSSSPIDTSCLHNNDSGVNETSEQRYVLKSSPRAVTLKVSEALVHQVVTTQKGNASTDLSSPIDTSCFHNNDSGVNETSNQHYVLKSSPRAVALTVTETLVRQAVTTQKENASTDSSSPIGTSCLHNNDFGVNETSDQRSVLKSSPRAVALTVSDTLVRQAVTTQKENDICSSITTESNRSPKAMSHGGPSSVVVENETHIKDCRPLMTDFTWAYEVWRRKGLLGTREVSTFDEAHSKGSDKQGSMVRLAESPEVDTRGIGDAKAKPKMIKERKSMPVSRKDDHNKRTSESFALILKQWRHVSDDKPCGHFLSPESQKSQINISVEEKNLETELPMRRTSLSYGRRSLKGETKQRSGAKEILNSEVSCVLHSKANEILNSKSIDVASSASVNHANKNTDEPAIPSHGRGDFEGDENKVVIKENHDNATATKSKIASDFGSLDRDLVSETQAQLSSSVSPDPTRQSKTASNSRHYKSVARDFLHESDKKKQRSKSATRFQQTRDSELSLSDNSTRYETPEEIMKSLVRPANTTAYANGRSDAPKARSKSVPKLRENSQMALSLSTLRHKLTKEYSEPHDGKPTCEMQIKRTSRRVVDLLDDRKKTTKRNAIDADTTFVPSSGAEQQYCSSIKNPSRNMSPKSQQTNEQTQDICVAQSSPRKQVERVRRSFEVCRCSSSLFSGDDEMIEFFLPLTGTACACGRRPRGLRTPDEPTSLVNILRPWQVEFLGSYGIYLGDQLVKAHHRSARELANALGRYRKKNNLRIFDTKSCSSALKIWSKTSKAFVRSIRAQISAGKLTDDFEIPNPIPLITSFLQIGNVQISGDEENRRSSVSSAKYSVASTSPMSGSVTSRHSNDGKLLKPLRDVH